MHIFRTTSGWSVTVSSVGEAISLLFSHAAFEFFKDNT